MLTYSVTCACACECLYLHICIYVHVSYINTYVWAGISICTCSLQVMRVYLQNLKTYCGDSVVCCKWQTALQQAHNYKPIRCRLTSLLAFGDVTGALHASKVQSPLCVWQSSIILCSGVCNNVTGWKSARFAYLGALCQNVYPNSGTSSLRWEYKLKNAWGQ